LSKLDLFVRSIEATIALMVSASSGRGCSMEGSKRRYPSRGMAFFLNAAPDVFFNIRAARLGGY
jgi:hypothetical protein